MSSGLVWNCCLWYLPACLRNLAKAKAKWGTLSRVLKQDRASIGYKSRIYLVLVSTVLLYGAETWVITDHMCTLLESFHHSCARHITRNYLRSMTDPDSPDLSRWIYPSTAGVLKRAKLLPIMDYIHQRREVFYMNYLAFSTTFSKSKRWTPAAHIRKFPRYHYWAVVGCLNYLQAMT